MTEHLSLAVHCSSFVSSGPAGSPRLHQSSHETGESEFSLATATQRCSDVAVIVGIAAAGQLLPGESVAVST